MNHLPTSSTWKNNKAMYENPKKTVTKCDKMRFSIDVVEKPMTAVLLYQIWLFVEKKWVCIFVLEAVCSPNVLAPSRAGCQELCDTWPKPHFFVHLGCPPKKLFSHQIKNPTQLLGRVFFRGQHLWSLSERMELEPDRVLFGFAAWWMGHPHASGNSAGIQGTH